MPITNNQVKLIRSLQRKKHRKEEQLFIAEGVKVVNEIIHSGFEIDALFSTNKSFLDNFEGAGSLISNKELNKISQLSTPNEVLAVVKMPKSSFDANLPFSELVLLLDRINDPGNLGTIVRTADWFGIKHIVCSEDTVDVFNSKCVQASMGSITRVEVHYLNPVELLTSYKDKPIVYGCAMTGENLNEAELSPKGLLILGSESHGIDKSLDEHIDRHLTIPRIGKAESLNAAIALGIVCAAFRR